MGEAEVEEPDLERYRQELTGFCYRMLGSGFEAEDAVQEVMIRAWRAVERFEGRASVRTWLYRIATNVCIDMGRQVQRRTRPMDLGPASPPDESLLGPVLPAERWVTPVVDFMLDPAELVVARESVRLAFVAALQHLPPRQRVALILCDVLRWPAAEAAELLDTTAASINSALQRARATLSALSADSRTGPLDRDTGDLLERYVEAFERYDMEALRVLLHDDAIQTMPPFAIWLRGPEAITAFMVQPGPSACRGSRLLATSANGCPAFAQYKADPHGGYAPWAIQVLEVVDGRIACMSFFLSQLQPHRLFPSFGFAPHLDAHLRPDRLFRAPTSVSPVTTHERSRS